MIAIFSWLWHAIYTKVLTVYCSFFIWWSIIRACNYDGHVFQTNKKGSFSTISGPFVFLKVMGCRRVIFEAHAEQRWYPILCKIQSSRWRKFIRRVGVLLTNKTILFIPMWYYLVNILFHVLIRKLTHTLK